MLCLSSLNKTRINCNKCIYILAAVMAIFEKTSQSRIVVDDTEKLICVVENAQNINKHTVSEFSLLWNAYGLINSTVVNRLHINGCLCIPKLHNLDFVCVCRSTFYECKGGRIRRIYGMYLDGIGTSRRCTRACSPLISNCHYHQRNLLEICNLPL